jgi:hypothetical protein
MAEPPTPAKPKRKRRWYQYSLRTFLLLITVFAIWLGWLTNEARKQREAVAWVEETSGWVFYDYEFKADGTYIQNAEPPAPEWVLQILDIHYFADVTCVDFFTSEINDLRPLAGLKDIERLALYNVPVSDLTPLAELNNLQRLSLIGTDVRDLTPLAALKNLKRFDIRVSPVDKEQVAKLRKALPNCEIVNDYY